MSPPLRACALVGRFADPRVAESLSVLLPHLRSRKVQVVVSQDAVLPAGANDVVRVPESAITEHADLVVAIGGDGTMLYASRLVAGRDVPLLGINRGRLGFLTDVMPQDMLSCLDQALAGSLQRDERSLLHARLRRANGIPIEALALNDIVLQKTETGRMLDFEMHIDGRYVNNHAGDGIVIASATGSTAYALSCGGPIVDPQLDVLVLAPICPHSLSDRPVIVPARAAIEIRLIERVDTRAQVVCDGAVLGELTPEDELHITRATERITLLHPPGYDYFSLLRSKLHWGRGQVNHSR